MKGFAGSTDFDVQALGRGYQHFETYWSETLKRWMVQYDYRHTNGELFSCVRGTRVGCRIACDDWLISKGWA